MEERITMRNQFTLTLALAALAASNPAFAQANPAPQPPSTAKAASAILTFDVASVRPAAPIDTATILAGLRAGKAPHSSSIEGLRATYTYTSLKELISYAYKVRVYQVSGPDWLATDRFDVAARLPEGATRDDVPAMLQALLTDRFNLAAHLETKEHPVLGLEIAKGGSKLQQSTTPNEPIDESADLKPGETKLDSVDGQIRVMRISDGSTAYNMGMRGTMTLKVDGQNGTMHLTGSGMKLSGLAVMLNILGGGNGRQVVDLTGLNGNYDLAVDFSLSDLVSSLRDQGIEIPTGPASASSGAMPSDPGGDSTLSDALGKLGLKLANTKAATPQLIVDHVDKTATEN
jgi:uncharacterized protein (TIGR03435 family)